MGQGGAVYVYGDSAAEVTECTFSSAANTSSGHNDFARNKYGAATFLCPVGSAGAPVSMVGTELLVTQLPPAAEVAQC